METKIETTVGFVMLLWGVGKAAKRINSSFPSDKQEVRTQDETAGCRGWLLGLGLRAACGF